MLQVCSTETAELNEEERLNKITETIIGVAINVHRELRPGLLESVYEALLIIFLILCVHCVLCGEK